MDLDLAALDPIWYVAAAGVLLLIIVVAAVTIMRKRRRRQHYKDRYGAEYQRTVERAGSRRAADRELQEREERRQQFELRPLEADERDRFRARWEDLQASFVDSPAGAVRSADELLDDVAARVGYPKAGREERLADLSVDHPATVEEYRQGRPRSVDAERGPTTEQLRQALLSSRSLFEAILGRDTEGIGLPSAPFRELDLDPAQGNGRGDAGAGADQQGRGTHPADTPAGDLERRVDEAPGTEASAAVDDQPLPRDDQPLPRDDQPLPRDDQPSPNDDQPFTSGDGRPGR